MLTSPAMKTTARTMLFSILTAGVLIIILGSVNARIGFLHMRLAIRPMLRSPGVTEFVFNPLGRISADTHRFPARLTLSVEEIDDATIVDLASGRLSYNAFAARALEKSGPFFTAFVVRVLVLGAAGGALGAALSFLFVPGGRGRPMALFVKRYVLSAGLGGGLTGLALASAIVYFTFFSYDASAFRSPRYEGLIARVPEVAEVVQQGIDTSDMLSDQMYVLSRNMSDFFLKLNEIRRSGPTQGVHLRILHVSDLHNNPLGVLMMQAVVRSLKPDLICDTGDLTDHGSPEELSFIAGIKDFALPYVAITGNHDSVQVDERLRSEYGATLLDGDMATVRGLRIMGFGDPKAEENFPKTAEMDFPGLNRLAISVKARLKRMKTRPQVLMIHDPVASRRLMGQVPLILSGHTHNATIVEEQGTVYVNAGTSGASGVRYFKNYEKPFYSMAVIDVTLGATLTVDRVTMLYADKLENDFGMYTKNFY